MTPEERKQIERVCGKDYKHSDIPTFIRNRDKKEMKKVVDYQKESLKQITKAVCPKCGDEVLGDEDGLCYRCI